MTIEGIPQPTQPESNKTSIYPERISSESYLDHMLDEIQEVSAGKGVIELTEDEKNNVLEYEGLLCEKLLPIKTNLVRTSTIYLDYFKTDEGRETLSRLNGGIEAPKDDESLKIILYNLTHALSEMDAEERKILEGKARDHSKKEVSKNLIATLDKDGNLGEVAFPVSEKIALILDEEKLLKKEQDLRGLKNDLKKQWLELDKEPLNVSESKKLVVEVYLQRINDFLIEINKLRLTSMAEKAATVGIENLSPTEREMLGTTESSEVLPQAKREENIARFDKLTYGADLEYTDGQRSQVGTTLKQYTEKIFGEWVQSATEKRQDIAKAGLDLDEIESATITPEKQKELAEGHLRQLGLLSSIVDYDPDREGPATDDGWQVHNEPGRSSAGVEYSQKALLLPSINKSINNVLTVQNGHEFGHIYQAINAEALPLKIFDQIEVGRREAFTEAGAIAIQNALSQEIFGRISARMPHYLIALQKKMEGGNYLEATKAYYQARVKPLQIQRERGEITEEEFQKKAHRTLKTSASTTRRIFKDSSLDSKSGYLTWTKDTVYAEQGILAEKLHERGMDELLMIRGVNLEVIYRLIKAGLFDPKDIKTPDTEFVSELWKERKPQYLLDTSSSQ